MGGWPPEIVAAGSPRRIARELDVGSVYDPFHNRAAYGLRRATTPLEIDPTPPCLATLDCSGVRFPPHDLALGQTVPSLARFRVSPSRGVRPRSEQHYPRVGLPHEAQ